MGDVTVAGESLAKALSDEIQYLNSVNTRDCEKLVIDKALHEVLAKHCEGVHDGKYDGLGVEVVEGSEVFRWKLI